jgi:GNAT superfamily N-acetyltransferase
MVLTAYRALPDYRKTVELLDGRQIIIRPICPDDRLLLMVFFDRLTDETRFFRYHYSKCQLTESELKEYCELDYRDNLALVAEIERQGKKEIIGVGSYCRLPDFHTAEVAFVVQDDEQRKGIGTQLLKHLSILAWQRDIHYFSGEVLRNNARMLSIFKKSDPGMKQVIDSGSTCVITLSVAETMSRTHQFGDQISRK